MSTDSARSSRAESDWSWNSSNHSTV